MNDRMHELRLASARLVRALAALGMCAGLLLACSERRKEMPSRTGDERCATCHGDPNRAGDFLLRAAPPRDLSGADDPSHPGVGAHQIHLRASSTHAAVDCSECHVVPDRVDSPGHADHGSPATLVFGALAGNQGSSPRYDLGTRSCTGSYCHGDSHAVWNAPRSSSAACGTCHGLPPALPHPQSERCSVCHGEVIDDQNQFIAPSLHVNGHVEYDTEGRCTACHGMGDDPAPPRDTSGNSARSAIGVGAHQAHLQSRIGRSLACTECHDVPDKVEDPGHIEGLPARVRLKGVATSAEHEPTWQRNARNCSDSWCHGPSPDSAKVSPSWTASGNLGCTSCHGAPPPLPHPQSSQCSACHGATVGTDNQTIVDRARHIDGVVDVAITTSCTACHGDQNAAPPRDLAGERLASLPGVGAHQTHVLGTERSRRVPCAECHRMPSEVLATGHLDSSGPAEVVFSGPAAAASATASYRQGSCQNTACHGALWTSGNASGGTHTEPTWTKVDGTQAACGSCHGLPPPPPHPYATLNPICSACHEDIAPDNLTFVRPDLHVDGAVTFSLP